MVKLVPEFLKKIIVQKGVNNRTNNTNTAEVSRSNTLLTDGLSHIKGVNFNSEEEEETSSGAINRTYHQGSHLELGITSNISTIALRDWGCPVYDEIREEGVFTGKYFTGFLRNYVASGDHSDALQASNKSKVIPKEEFDFTEYISQVSVFYSMMEEGINDAQNTDSINENHLPSETHVPKEYYSEDYQVEKNEVFRKELECIPEVMSSMEAQLETVNAELQEMLERRYIHVHEACTSVEELHARFQDLTQQINRIRADIESETALTNTPTRNTTNADVEKELDSVLQNGIARKKDLQILLGYLQELRGITALPEYIQSVSESHGIAIANIVATCSIKYLYGDAGKFKLAKSMASVLNDTIANLERVAETKFVKLALMALLELGNNNDVTTSIELMKTSLRHMQQPLVALMNATTLRDALSTLRTTSNVSRNTNKIGKFDNWYSFADTFEKQKVALLAYLFLCQVWGCMILRQILCVQRMKRRDAEILQPEESTMLIQKILHVIRETLCPTSPRGNLTANSPINRLITKAIVLPTTCEDAFDYASYFECQSMDEVILDSGIDTDIANISLVDEYLGYCASIKNIVDDISKNAFADFASQMILYCTWKEEREVQDFVTFIEGYKTFRTKYDRLLAEINANDVFFSMLWQTLETEWNEHKSHAVESNWLPGIKNGLANLEKSRNTQLGSIVEDNSRKVGMSCLESMKVGNMVAVQNAFVRETWDKYKTSIYAMEQDEEMFSLVTSCTALDERLNLYPFLAEALPDVADAVAQDCVHLVEMFHSLVDAEVSSLEFSPIELDYTLVRKSCLMAEALRYFSHRVIDVVTKALNNASESINTYERSATVVSEELESNFKDLYQGAQKSSDDMESLKQRLLHMLSEAISLQLKQHVTLWVSQRHSEAYHDGEVKKIIHIIQQSVDVISDIIKDPTDVQLVYEMAFQHVHVGVNPGNIEDERKEYFRDSCADIITQLSHYTCIKLEICCLADTLANELFS
ncbi:hypothetical protein BBOV_I000250 [Babesia bovis T2Bo]|uniref:Uncharacterized protein n=1 Tax=Babesia bovis TaxID=5865 RepID=A7AX46_BABBO|nr:hypothetical protein BBOV_I000250 [Babesia bovis T2Bo]EDO05119.1 hypothetical protein BBOV_I000250 [Babesia bovis T2Bo]|eukprot:XP_001608687.1 hypothetical protein [Babesia bovis T2Bo]